MPAEQLHPASGTGPAESPEKKDSRRAVSRLAVVAAILAGADILFVLLTDSGRSCWPYGERVVPFAGLITLALGITAAFAVGGTRRPATGALMAAAAILVGGLCFLVIPATCRVQESAKRAACKGNLRQIGICLHLYADENDGRFPSSLTELYPTYTDNVWIFSCPSEPSSWKDFEPGGKVTEKSSSHSYVGGLSAAMPGRFIVAYDKTLENHQKRGKESGRNVHSVDSSVTWWPASREADFQRRLALQAEAVEKWRASGKPVEAFSEFISPELRELMDKW